MTVIFIILSSIQMTAQNDINTNATADSKHSPVRITVDGSSVSIENKQNTDQLFFGPASTLYVADRSKQFEQETPTRIEINAEKLNTLSNYEQRKAAASVEVLIVKVESQAGFESKLTTEQLSSYSNLKYILILCTIDPCDRNVDSKSCIERKVITMVDKKVLEEFDLYYLVSIDQ